MPSATQTPELEIANGGRILMKIFSYITQGPPSHLRPYPLSPCCCRQSISPAQRNQMLTSWRYELQEREEGVSFTYPDPERGGENQVQRKILGSKPSLGPRPKPTPVWIASSIMCGEGRVILEAICTGVGLGLVPRLAPNPKTSCTVPLPWNRASDQF